MDNDTKKKEYLVLLNRSRRRSFYLNVLAFFIVNGLLTILNVATFFSHSGNHSIWEIWVVWPIVGWGIGLIFQGYSVFFNGDDEMRMRELEIELGIQPRRSRDNY